MSPTDQRATNSAFNSAAVTLTLGILGSSVLPVPYAISRLGVFPAIAIGVAVGYANSYTGTLLIRMAHYTKTDTYESVCEAANGGSKLWRIIAHVSLIGLLFGTLAGDAALLADTGVLAVEDFFKEGQVPSFLENNKGRSEMVLLITFLVFPLSLTKQIRQLEKAATAGLALVLVLAIVVARAALSAGFPALKSGELPLFSVATKADLPEAVAVLSFAFYLQPMLLPLLKEMPPGDIGVELTSKALQFVTMVVATGVYLFIGIFAASRYGLSTQGDFLVNKWTSSNVLDGFLDSMTAIYLSISMAPMCMTLRYQLDSLLDYGKEAAAPQEASYNFAREFWFTLLILGSSMTVALLFPEAAEKIFSITGATAVCLVCYVLPIAAHLRLFFRQRHRVADSQLEEPLVVDMPSSSSSSSIIETEHSYPSYIDDVSCLERYSLHWFKAVAVNVVLPLSVMILGSGCCVSSLVLSISGLISPSS